MVWILPGLLIAWTFAYLGAQAAWLAVLGSLSKPLMIATLVALLAAGGWFVARRQRELGR